LVLLLLILGGLSAGCGGIPEPAPFDPLPLPTTQPLDPLVRDRMHTVRDGVAALRGLPVNDTIVEGFLERDDFREHLAARSQLTGFGQRAFEDAMTISYQQMQILEPGEDLASTQLEHYGAGVAGFYDYSTRSLVILEDAFADGVEGDALVAHEYVHSMQDAAFGLKKLQDRGTGLRTEYAATLDCVIEGDAELTTAMYMAEMHHGEWLQALEDLKLSVSEGRPFRRYSQFNYRECATFVYRVWERGGWTAVNALYNKPPATTEQVLHPEKFFAGEGMKLARSIDIGDSIGSGWRLIAGGGFGEFDLYLYLRAAGFDDDVSRRIATGWGGGEVSLYSSLPDASGRVDDVVTHIALVWDTQADFADFRSFYARALSGLGNMPPDMTSGGTRWDWEARTGDSTGAAMWDEARLRVDILFGTDARAVQVGLKALADYAARKR
jgi:hypothetical protein